LIAEIRNFSARYKGAMIAVLQVFTNRVTRQESRHAHRVFRILETFPTKSRRSGRRNRERVIGLLLIQQNYRLADLFRRDASSGAAGNSP
jgi:hypothetical protein